MSATSHAHVHTHGHSHGHGPSHAHAPASFGRAFAIAIALNLGFVIVETVAGFRASSIALVADAGHNMSDVLGLLVAWGGTWLAQLAPSARFSYGFKKASILSALINALVLLVAIGAIGAEAVRRFFHPAPTHGQTVIVVAAIGIVVNGLTAWLFARGREHDINIEGAFLHMASDALVSVAVVFAGFVILWTGQEWVDPAMSLAVAIVILWSTFGLLKESVGMTLAGVPSGIDVEEVQEALAQIDGVDTVHDLHVWALSTTETALTAHIVTSLAGDPDGLLEIARTTLHDRFRIEHCTIQVERHHPAHHRDC